MGGVSPRVKLVSHMPSHARVVSVGVVSVGFGGRDGLVGAQVLSLEVLSCHPPLCVVAPGDVDVVPM